MFGWKIKNSTAGKKRKKREKNKKRRRKKTQLNRCVCDSVRYVHKRGRSARSVQPNNNYSTAAAKIQLLLHFSFFYSYSCVLGRFSCFLLLSFELLLLLSSAFVQPKCRQQIVESSRTEELRDGAIQRVCLVG